MCSSQRSQAFELATITEQLQVGGGYTVLIKNVTKTVLKSSKGVGAAGEVIIG